MQIVPEAAVIDHPLFRVLVNQVSALARNLSGPKATFKEVDGGWGVGLAQVTGECQGCCRVVY